MVRHREGRRVRPSRLPNVPGAHPQRIRVVGFHRPPHKAQAARRERRPQRERADPLRQGVAEAGRHRHGARGRRRVRGRGAGASRREHVDHTSRGRRIRLEQHPRFGPRAEERVDQGR